jgi:hypothetical protein
MTRTRITLSLLVLLAAACSARPAAAQEFPKPTAEHERLKAMEGTWEVTINIMGGESKGKGTLVSKMDLGGFWLFGDFKGDFGGAAFAGRSIDGYDIAKKKYVSVWVDSMSTTPMFMEGTLDKDGKVMTMEGMGQGFDGKPTKIKSVTEFKDADTIVFTMSAPGPDGKDATMMTITYKRKK